MRERSVAARIVVIAAVATALGVSACGSQASQNEVAACKANPTCARYLREFTAMVKKYGPAPGMGATWCAAEVQSMVGSDQSALKRACSLAVSHVQQ
jgi:hypothetical protein